MWGVEPARRFAVQIQGPNVFSKPTTEVYLTVLVKAMQVMIELSIQPMSRNAKFLQASH